MAVDPAATQWRETVGDYGRTGGLSRLWNESGLNEIQEADLIVELEFASFDDFWLPHLEGQAQAGSVREKAFLRIAGTR